MPLYRCGTESKKDKIYGHVVMRIHSYADGNAPWPVSLTREANFEFDIPLAEPQHIIPYENNEHAGTEAIGTEVILTELQKEPLPNARKASEINSIWKEMYQEIERSYMNKKD